MEEVARTQIVESTEEEEPSLVRPPGRIKTPPHFRAYFRYCPEVLAEALRTARAKVPSPPKSSSSSTSLNFDFGSSTNCHNRDSESFDDLFTTATTGSNSTPRDEPGSLDIFASPKKESGTFDDLLGGFGEGSGRNGLEKDDKGGSDFDDLLTGFGRSRSPSNDSCALMEFKEMVPASESSPIVTISQTQMGSEKQIAESTKEEPSLVGPPGIIKTSPHLFADYCDDQAKNDETWFTALDEVRKQQLTGERTSVGGRLN